METGVAQINLPRFWMSSDLGSVQSPANNNDGLAYSIVYSTRPG